MASYFYDHVTCLTTMQSKSRKTIRGSKFPRNNAIDGIVRIPQTLSFFIYMRGVVQIPQAISLFIYILAILFNLLFVHVTFILIHVCGC